MIGDLERDQVVLPFERSSATTARRMLGDVAHELGLAGDRYDDVLIVVQELVVNALDHGRPSDHQEFTLFWAVEGGLLLIGVRDDGTEGVIAVQPVDSSRPRGRGLALVEAISVRWGIERSGGTSVSAWLRMAG